jgi:RNA polymerase sigma-70 factor (ECF subfamily)
VLFGVQFLISTRPDITYLLRELAQGNRSSESKLLELVYVELHRLASGYMRRERRDHTLQASALVNEAYVRLVGGGALPWESRAHFYVAAARTMRRILIDHARNHQAAKRSGQKVEISETLLLVEEDPARYLDLEEALKRLAEIDERQARIVDLRFYAGLDVVDVAALLSISEKTVKRDWAMARAWLENQLSSS